jgi:hypothetical protein
VEPLLEGLEPGGLVAELGAVVVLEVVPEPVGPGVLRRRLPRRRHHGVHAGVVERGHRQPPALGAHGDAVHRAAVGPAADHLDLVPDVDEDPAAPAGRHGDPVLPAEELEPAHRLILQHDDDAAGVGVRAEAPHHLRPRARRVHGELGPHGGRRERAPDVAGVEAQVEAHALGEQLRQRHRLSDVRVQQLAARVRHVISN